MTSRSPVLAGSSPVRLRRALVVLRVLTGLVWLTNGLAKATGMRVIDLGFFRGSLITVPSARGILRGAVATTELPPLGALYAWVAGPAWPVFSVMLTLAELAIGLGLIAGVLTRVAAVGGLLLIGPIWLMLWPRGGYLWDYPGDLVPLAVLAIAPVPGLLWRRILRRTPRRASMGA